MNFFNFYSEIVLLKTYIEINYEYSFKTNYLYNFWKNQIFTFLDLVGMVVLVKKEKHTGLASASMKKFILQLLYKTPSNTWYIWQVVQTKTNKVLNFFENKIKSSSSLSSFQRVLFFIGSYLSIFFWVF